MIEYWHWHTLPFGTETYWAGVLPHSGRPGRVHREIVAVGQELREAGPLVSGLTPDADVALVFSMPTRWAMQRQPALGDPDAAPDPRAYQGLIEPFDRGAFEAGLQVRILHAAQLGGVDLTAAQVARRHPVLVASGLYIATDDVLTWLHEYARARRPHFPQISRPVIV
jgi:beta-galactosidase